MLGLISLGDFTNVYVHKVFTIRVGIGFNLDKGFYAEFDNEGSMNTIRLFLPEPEIMFTEIDEWSTRTESIWGDTKMKSEEYLGIRDRIQEHAKKQIVNTGFKEDALASAHRTFVNAIYAGFLRDNYQIELHLMENQTEIYQENIDY